MLGVGCSEGGGSSGLTGVSGLAATFAPRPRSVLSVDRPAGFDLAAAIAGIYVDTERHGHEAEPELQPPPPPIVNRSIAALAYTVESRIVEAAWTLARLPDRERAWIYGQQRHGLDYLQDASERWANAVDPVKGTPVGFGEMPVRPGPPTAKEISRWVEALSWLSMVKRDHARVVFGAAASRRGDMDRRVSWRAARAMSGLEVSRQRLATIYDQSIADIAAELVAREARSIRCGR